MQEHELSLIDAIARLADASDGESGKYLASSFCLILCMILSFVKYKAESVWLHNSKPCQDAGYAIAVMICWCI